MQSPEGETEGEKSAAEESPAEKKPRRQTGARRAKAPSGFARRAAQALRKAGQVVWRSEPEKPGAPKPASTFAD